MPEFQADKATQTQHTSTTTEWVQLPEMRLISRLTVGKLLKNILGQFSLVALVTSANLSS